MGHKVLFITCISLVAFSATKAESSQQQDVEAGDPYLQSLAEFAAGTLVSNDIVDPSIDGGAWMLHRILDAQYVPPNPPAQPAVYFFTLELSLECNNDTSHIPACDETNSTYVRLCEVAVADEPWAKRRSLVPGKIACASQESNIELAFVGTTIANSVPLDDLALVALAEEALAQMANKTNAQHSLVRIESAKRVSDSDSVTYYLALNITTQTSGSPTSQVSHEICEVSMEEVPVSTEAASADVPTKVEPILRSLRCFSTGDEDEAERLGLQKFPQEDLSAPHVRTAVLAAYGQIDGEFQSNFKLKLLGSKVLRTVVSLDSGTRDSRLQLGLGSSFCIKRPDLEQEEQDESKTCNLDPDRDTFVCDITVIQWPWVADAFLFSDLTCQPTNVSSIAAQLEPLFEAEAEESTEDSGEVQGNGLEDDQGAEGKAEITANTGPCTGCPQEANVQDPKIQKLANFALSFMEATSNEPTKQAIVEVKKATAQVVAGIKYELTLQLAQTNCKKGDAEEQCVPNLVTSKVCVVEILEQSWRNSTKVLGVECVQTSVPPVLDSNEAPVREARLTGSSGEEKPLSPKAIRPTLGGWKVVDPESESIQSYGKIALEHFNSQSNSESVGKLVKIVSAKTQVVAGTNVNLQLEVGFTGCKKGGDSQENCDLDEKQNHEICDVRIFKNLEGSSTVKSLNCKTVMTEELEMSASSLSEDIDESPFVGEAPKVFKAPEFSSREVSSSVLGRYKPVDKKSQGIENLVEQAMAAVNEQFNDDSFFMVSRVLSFTSARSGEPRTPIGIRLSLEVEAIDCNKADGAGNLPCVLVENEARQICHVGLQDRPWLNLREVTSVECKPVVTGTRAKATRNAKEVEPIVVGGIQEANSESAEIQEYAEFAVPHVQSVSNFGYVLQLVEILSSTTQVVAGKSVTIEMVLGQTNCAIGSEEAVNGPCDLDSDKHRQTCTVKIWDRPWLKLREITEVACQAVGIPLVFNKEEEVTDVVDGPAVGGITEADVQSPEIQEYAQFALPNIEAGTNSGYTFKLVEVLSATTQVVEGQSVTVKMVLGQTSCKIGSEEAANGPCEVDNNKSRQTCTVQIWDRPWLNSREITQMSCESVGIPLVKAALEVASDDNRDAPPPPGSPVPIDVDAEEIQTLLPVAINGINQQSNDVQVLKVIRVQNAFKKVVAGILYRLILEVGVTSCAKGAEADLCEVNPDKPRQICDVKVLEQPGTSTREVQEVECHALPGVAHQYGRQERADAIAAELVVSSPPFLGGISEVAVDDESVKEIAQFATTTIAAQQNQEGGLQLIKIQKARKQVVAGWKYFLTLELGFVNGKDDNQICEVVVFDRPWTQTRDLSEVKCSITTSGPRVAKSKRLGLLGGINPADPADLTIQEMAQFATTTIAAQQNQADGLKLISVKEAKKQVVSGTKYYLTLELGSVSGDKDNQVCELVVFDQPRTQTREVSDVKCEITTSSGLLGGISPTDPANPDVQEIVQLEEIPEIVRPQLGFVGGIELVDPADLEIQEIAQFATTTIAAQQNEEGGLKLITIKQAGRQLVAGWNYYLTLELGSVSGDKDNQVCEVVVFDQSWTQTREVSDVKCSNTANGPSDAGAAAPGTSPTGLLGGSGPANPANPDVQEITEPQTGNVGGIEPVGPADLQIQEVVRPQLSLVGGITSIDTRDYRVRDIAQFATIAIAAQENQAGGLKLIKVKEAKRQLVDGWNYYLTLELGSVSGNKGKQVCEVAVFVQAWTQTRRVSNVKCVITNYGPISPSSSGLIIPANTSDSDVQEIAQFATKTIAAQQNEEGGLRLISIKQARRQLVAGMNYYLTLELGSVTGGKDNQVCELVVLDQPWSVGSWTRHVSDVKCVTSGPGNAGSFVLFTTPVLQLQENEYQIAIVGGIEPVDPAGLEIQEVAEFATTAIAAQQNDTGGLKLISIKWAGTGGLVYHLTLELGSVTGDKDNQICEVSVFDQPWIPLRELSSLTCKSTTNEHNAAVPTLLGASEPQIGIAGGISPANPADPQIQEIAQFATTSIAAQQNEAGGLKLIKIKEARRQIVAGTKYYLTLELGSADGQGSNQVCEVVVDVPWEQLREISDVKCSIATSGGSRSAKSVQLGAAAPRLDASSRGLAGGVNLANPADPNVQEIAQFATTAVAAKQNQAGGLKLVNIKKVRKQVVAGTNYYLTLELASVNGQGANQICELVVFDQVWTQTREVSDIKCSIARSGARIAKSARSGAGPSPVSVGRLVGGLSSANPADPTVREIAQFATSTIAAQQNQAGGLKLVNIKQARTQVVAGTNYYLTLELASVNGQGANQVCEVVVFDQVWTKTRKVSDVKCSPSGSRKKRDVEPIRSSEATPPNSALKSIAIDDPKVQEMSAFAVPVINQRSNAPNPLHLVKTHTAFTRVVSGLKYYLVIEVSTSNCTPSDTNDCKAEHRRGAQYCQVVIWEQAWLNKKEVTDLSCALTKPKARHNPKNKGKKNPARKGGARAGAASSVGVATPDIQEYATFALNEINAQSNDQQHLVLTQIREATSQVVSGKNIGLTLEVGYSNCTKGSANANCEVDPARIKQVCRVKIWDRPWLNNRRVTSLKCEEPATRRHGAKRKPSRVVRQILGGFSAGNPKDPEAQTMADFAVRFLRWNGNEGVTVVEVKSVQKQLVSGMNYKMILLVSPTNCGKSCPVEECDITVYDQPWTGTRKVTSVSCAPVRRKREAIEEETGHLYYMEAFRGFLAKFKKVYATMEEFEHRYHVYRVNQERIQYMQENEQGTAQYGDTEFSDLTEEEFRAFYTGFRPDLKGNHIVNQAVIPNVTLPDAFDWRTHNVVTPVKNQGMCGSCWAYSVTGNVEGLYAVKHNKLYSLSEQELVDCDKLDQGCNGGLPENAYKAIQELGGLETEEDYPYEGKDDQCRIKPETAAVQVTGSVEISQNETEMAKWLVANGPISIGINANAMQFYNGGVSHPWKFLCNAKSIDHGVLIVGYGVKEYPLFNKTLPYWIVKNSWGNRWGEQGYYRVYRGDGTCGVNMMATSAVVN